jgi:hypothetical protein
MVPGGWEGPEYGKTFLHVFILKKKIFSRTSRLISIKLSTNHSCMKGIQVYSNVGPSPLQRGIITKVLKYGWGHLNIFLS